MRWKKEILDAILQSFFLLPYFFVVPNIIPFLRIIAIQAGVACLNKGEGKKISISTELCLNVPCAVAKHNFCWFILISFRASLVNIFAPHSGMSEITARFMFCAHVCEWMRRRVAFRDAKGILNFALIRKAVSLNFTLDLCPLFERLFVVGHDSEWKLIYRNEYATVAGMCLEIRFKISSCKWCSVFNSFQHKFYCKSVAISVANSLKRYSLGRRL